MVLGQGLLGKQLSITISQGLALSSGNLEISYFFQHMCKVIELWGADS